MNRFIEIDFRSVETNSVFSLNWKLVDETHALFWFKCLHQLLRDKVPSYYRFTGLNTKSKNLSVLAEQLNTIFDLINRNTSYQIDQRADGDFSQDFANSIHHHFEVLYGDAHKPSELYKNSSPLIRSAITKINHIIHDMEAISRTQEDASANKAIINEFLNRPQYKMHDDFLKHFNLNIDFGDLVLHYGIIGKSWWEVFLDQDEVIYNEAIRPLSFISGEFDIHFSQIHPDKKTLAKFNTFLEERGLDRNDPKLCLGYLQLAKLNLSKTSKAIVSSHLEKELAISSIRLLENEEELIEMDLEADEIAEKGFFQIHPPVNISNKEKLILKKAAVQLIPLASNTPEALLEGDIFKRDWRDLDHCVCLVGTSDTNRIVIGPSEGQIELSTTIYLGLGDVLELAYDALEDRYLPVTSKKNLKGQKMALKI